jgi:hypothetical protein
MVRVRNTSFSSLSSYNFCRALKLMGSALRNTPSESTHSSNPHLRVDTSRLAHDSNAWQLPMRSLPPPYQRVMVCVGLPSFAGETRASLNSRFLPGGIVGSSHSYCGGLRYCSRGRETVGGGRGHFVSRSIGFRCLQTRHVRIIAESVAHDGSH